MRNIVLVALVIALATVVGCKEKQSAPAENTMNSMDTQSMEESKEKKKESTAAMEEPAAAPEESAAAGDAPAETAEAPASGEGEGASPAQ